MSTSPDRQTFRALVADIAARAKARLPEAVNGRIEAAVKLVLVQDVTPQEDGSILVGSSTEPLKTYRLVGTACECQDFTRGQAPDGWCQHRIAAGIAKRVRELLPQVPEDSQGPGGVSPASTTPQPEGGGTTSALPEAPARVNCHLTIAGRQVQLTLRASDEERLLQRLQTILERYPVPTTAPQASSTAEGWCAKHGIQMQWNAGKEGRKGWWSHKTAEGWCKGR
jgi:hypothetical protein